MKVNSIQMKMTLWAGVCLFITLAVIVAYAIVVMRDDANTARDNAIEAAKLHAVTMAKQYANQIRVTLEGPFDSVRTLAQLFSGMKGEDAWLELDRDGVNAVLQTLLEQNPKFAGIYTAWEPDAFDGLDSAYQNFEGHDATGRFIPYWKKDKSGNFVVQPLADYEREGVGNYYLLPQKTKNEVVIEPHISSVQGKDVLITSLIAPIIVDNQFCGIVGIDLRVDVFQRLVDDGQTLYDGTAQIALVSHHGALVAFTGKPELSGIPVEDLYEELREVLLQHLSSGKIISVTGEQLEVCVPLAIGHTTTPWSVNILVPMNQITAAVDAQMQQVTYKLWSMTGIGVLCAIFAFSILGGIIRTITKPLNNAVEVAYRIAKGDLTQKIKAKGQDEIGQLLAAMQQMAEKISQVLNETDDLTQAVQQGNLAARGNAETYDGVWRELVQGINNVIEAFVSPLNMTATYLERISKGELPEKIATEYEGDFNAIKNNLNILINSTEKITSIAQEIAGGNLSVSVQKRSQHDQLMEALKQMVWYLQDVASIAEKISKKDLQVKVIPRSAQDLLNQSLRRMVITLQTTIQELQNTIHDAELQKTHIETQSWVKTGQTELNDLMHGEQEPKILAKQIITYLANFLGAQVGAMYLTHEQNGGNVLKLAASYAYNKRKGNPNTLKFGEGPVGQAALERECILYSELSNSFITILNKSGETPPHHLLVAPFIYENRVKGVIELGTIREFTERQRDFLEQTRENIAIAIHSAQTRLRMQELLQATQEQAEKLQAQQEQLQENNEMLEAQTRTLRESEQKLQRQQKELLRTNRELELQTVALEEQQKILEEKNVALKQSRQLVEEKVRELELVNKYKSDFLANMSHEFRTPLNGILGYTQIFKRDPSLTEKQKKSVEIMHRCGEHLLTIINDVLELTRIEAQRIRLEPAEFHLPGILTSIVEVQRREAQKRGITFSYDVTTELPTSVYGDEKRLRQVLMNLLSNAIKFTVEGSVTFRVKREWKDGVLEYRSTGEDHQITNTPTLRFEVEDTGIGIPSEHLKRIFEMFYQVSDKRIYAEGTGLGLAISQELVRLMGGELQVKSTVNQGSTFWFEIELPVMSQESKTQAQEPRRIVGFNAPSTASSTGSPVEGEDEGEGEGRVEEKAKELFEEPGEEQPSDEDMVVPSLEELNALYELAMMGDLYTLQDRVMELENDNTKLTLFSSKICQLADNFEVEEIQKILEHYMGKKESGG